MLYEPPYTDSAKFRPDAVTSTANVPVSFAGWLYEVEGEGERFCEVDDPESLDLAFDVPGSGVRLIAYVFEDELGAMYHLDPAEADWSCADDPASPYYGCSLGRTRWCVPFTLGCWARTADSRIR